MPSLVEIECIRRAIIACMGKGCLRFLATLAGATPAIPAAQAAPVEEKWQQAILVTHEINVLSVNPSSLAKIRFELY